MERGRVEAVDTSDDPREELRELIARLPGLYSRVDEELKADPSIDRLVGETFRKFIKINEEAIAIHRRTRDLSQSIDAR